MGAARAPFSIQVGTVFCLSERKKSLLSGVVTVGLRNFRFSTIAPRVKCGDICLLILLKRHLPRWLYLGTFAVINPPLISQSSSLSATHQFVEQIKPCFTLAMCGACGGGEWIMSLALSDQCIGSPITQGGPCPSVERINYLLFLSLGSPGLVLRYPLRSLSQDVLRAAVHSRILITPPRLGRTMQWKWVLGRDWRASPTTPVCISIASWKPLSIRCLPQGLDFYKQKHYSRTKLAKVLN